MTQAVANDTAQTEAPTTPISMDQVVARFSDLPTLAPVAVEVLQLADDENAGMNEIANAISNDPGLTVRLLRLANSPAYNRGNEVTNLSTAASLLGLQTLKMVTLGFTLVADMGSDKFDSSIIWRRGLASSVLARRFASDTNPELADDAFVVGLLANVGKLAMAEEAVYLAAIEENGPWLTPPQEERMFGITSDEATAQILANWGLPQLLIDAVRSRHGLDDRESQSPLGGILEVADDAACLMLADEDAVRANALDSLTSSAACNLGMTIGDVELIIQELEADLNEMASTFDLGSMSQTPVEEIVKTAQTQLTMLSLNIATQLNQEQEKNENLTELNRKLEKEASTDSLTGLPNRRTFDAYLGNQVAGRLRTPRSTMLALIIFDLDHFKAVNDNFGHGVGDEVLQEVGRRLLDGSRRGELAARVGGEEFAIIMPDVVAQELAGAAERMRAMIGDEPIDTAIGPLAVTASIGASYTAVTRSDVESVLYKTADDALYDSKNGGRDRVTIKPLDE